MIAHDPLHGSGRAGFPHPALTLGGDAQAVPRIRVHDADRGQPAVDIPPHPFPADLPLLAAPGHHTLPEAGSPFTLLQPAPEGFT